MSNVTLIKYPIDVTGISPDNKIEAERHQVSTLNRVITPTHGYFYAESLIVTYRGNTLKLGTHYKLDGLNGELTALTGKAISTTIVILDNTIMEEIDITYQCYGTGDNFSKSYIAQLVESATDKSEISFYNLIDRPDTYPPSAHRHPLEDTYGWQAVVQVLQDIANCIAHLRISNDKNLYAYIDSYQRDVVARLEEIEELASEAREQIGSITDFKTDSQTALNELKDQIAAVQELSGVTTLLNQYKEDTTTEINLINTSLKSTITALETKLTKSISDNVTTLTNSLKTKLTEAQVLALLTSKNYITNTSLNSTLANYASSARVTTLENTITTKIDTTTAKQLIAEAAKTAVWDSITNKPDLWIHTEETATTASTNLKTSFGTTGYGSATAISPVPATTGWYTAKGVLDTYTSSTTISQLYLSSSGMMYRSGTRSGNLVSKWNSWNYVPLVWDDVISNLNSLTSTGFGYIATNAQNRPYTTTTNGTVMNILTKTQQAQLVFNATGSHWIRIRELNGSWTNEKIVTSSNIDSYLSTSTSSAASASALTTEISDRKAADTALETKLTNLINTKTSSITTSLGNYVLLSTYNSKVTDLTNLINNRVVLSTYNTKIASIETSLGKKVETSLIQQSKTDRTSGRLPKWWEDNKLHIGHTRLYESGSSSNYTELYKNGDYLYFTSKIKPVDINLSSDIALKENLIPLEHALDKIDKLNGYTYRWKDTKQIDYGVVAQEVEKVLPYAVDGSGEHDDYKSVAYLKLIPLLIEGIKELREENRVLRDRLDKLEGV